MSTPICPICGSELDQLHFADGIKDNLFSCQECKWPDNRWTIEKAQLIKYKQPIVMCGRCPYQTIQVGEEYVCTKCGWVRTQV